MFAMLARNSRFCTNGDKYETLRDDEPFALLSTVAHKHDGCAARAALQLTPVVLVLYKGEKYGKTPRLE